MWVIWYFDTTANKLKVLMVRHTHLQVLAVNGTSQSLNLQQQQTKQYFQEQMINSIL